MRRLDHNPLLTRRDVPCNCPELTDVSSVFNPGAVRIDENICLLLRVQNRGRETFLLKAVSPDGRQFQLNPHPTIITGMDALKQTIYHVYDPRITKLGEQLWITVAVDTDDGCRAVLTKSDDLTSLEFVGLMWNGEARNAVVFPEKINGKYTGLVRPNVAAPDQQITSGSEIWLVESADLQDWQPIKPILNGRPHYWDELIGAGPPPVKTKQGWLCIYHGIATHFAAANIYQVGVCLLDLEHPATVKARSRYNILEPREDYELTGQVPNVVFPSGIIVENYDPDGYALLDSRVVVYYGAADTVIAAATTTIQELLDHCYAGKE